MKAILICSLISAELAEPAIGTNVAYLQPVTRRLYAHRQFHHSLLSIETDTEAKLLQI
jgi:hypothetical protein